MVENQSSLVEKICAANAYALDRLVHGRIFLLRHVPLVTKRNGIEGLQYD